MILEQIRSTDGTGTLSYMIVDEHSHVAAVIDPNLEDVQKIASRSDELRVRITHIIDTHTHADHVTGAGELKKIFDSRVIMHENTKHKWKVVDQGDAFGIGDTLRANAKVEIDQYVIDGDSFAVGSLTFKVLFTPGHSDNHITLQLNENIFTGDLLLIGQAGRSDLPGGSAEEQYESLFQKIFPLPDKTRIYPGHDYEDNIFALLGNEKKANPFLQPRTKAEYIEFVKDFFPPIAEEISGRKMSLQCGTTRVMTSSDTLKNVNVNQLEELLNQNPSLCLIDVREPFELMAFGAIPGVRNIPCKKISQRQNELPPRKTTPIVVVCARGSRSAEVSHYLSKQGYTNVMNLEGGTAAWKRSGKRVTRGMSAV